MYSSTAELVEFFKTDKTALFPYRGYQTVSAFSLF